jgi:hypothetical protein
MNENQLTTTRSTAVAARSASNISPWRQAANEEAGANFGTLLKFVKGDWLVGEEQTAVSPTACFVANMDEVWRGWIKWVDQQPIEHVIGREIDGHQVCARDLLGDLDQARWETDGNGVKRDPWQRVTYLVLRNMEDDEVATFTSTSDGGRKAVGKLCDRYDHLRHKHKAQMPIVALKSESYYNKKYRTDVLKPKFQIVGWDYWDEDAKNDPDAALEAQRDAEMSDKIPF